MKKALLSKSLLVIAAVLGFAFIAQAADTNTVFQWQRPDQSGTLTISNLTLKGTVSLPAGASVGNLSTVTTNVVGNQATASGTVTPVGRITWTNCVPVFHTVTLLDSATNPVTMNVCTAQVTTVYAAISNVTVTVDCVTNVVKTNITP